MPIATDYHVIAALETLMAAMREQGLPTAAMQRFLDVGEWLLCFEGAWMLAKDDAGHPLRRLPAYGELEAWFADDLA